MKFTALGIVLSGFACAGSSQAGVFFNKHVLGLENRGAEVRADHVAGGIGWGDDYALFLTDGFCVVGRSMSAEEVEAAERRLAELCSFSVRSCAETTSIAPIEVFTGLWGDEILIDLAMVQPTEQAVAEEIESTEDAK
jgi:hypothetical protein